MLKIQLSPVVSLRCSEVRLLPKELLLFWLLPGSSCCFLHCLSRCVVWCWWGLLASNSAKKTSFSQLGQLPELPEKQLALALRKQEGMDGWVMSCRLKLSLKPQEEPVVPVPSWWAVPKSCFAWFIVGQDGWHVPLVCLRGLFVSCRVLFWKSLLTGFNSLLSFSKTRIMVSY